jgi:uncharacterized FlgJ-related protein
MLKVNFSLILIFLGQLLFSQKILREEYILLYKDIAIEEMQRTGVPASITLSQGILESGSGNSRLAKRQITTLELSATRTGQEER